MSHESGNRWWQSQAFCWSAVAFALFAVYIGTYGALASRGIREAITVGDNEFLYVSRPTSRSLSETEYQIHRWCRRFFKPLEWIDPRMEDPPHSPGKWRAQIFLRDLP